MSSLKLTKRSVEAATAPSNGQAFIRDSELQGFGLRITSTGFRSFIVEARVKGRNVRHTLGAYPRLSPEIARGMAMHWLAEVAQGRDPVAASMATKVAGTTLGEALEAYIGSRELREKTIRDYRGSTRTCFQDWLDRPIREIDREMVEHRHREIGEARGKALANLSMRILRAVLRFGRDRYNLPDVATDRLSASRSWYRIERRTGHLKPHELAHWIEAVEHLEADHRDYLLTLLPTGLRRTEAASLRWEDVDLKGRTLTIPGTVAKNHHAHVLPLGSRLQARLEARAGTRSSELVFSPEGRLIDPRMALARVTRATGIQVTCHDLRRTFATVAEALDLPYSALKRLLNHVSTDVTGGYLQIGTERLRGPMQAIEDRLFAAREGRTAEVVQLRA